MRASPAEVGAEAALDCSNVPERAVAVAVLQLALLDLEDPQRLSTGDAPEVLVEARMFCLSDQPEWRQAREAWCCAADVDPQYFQRQAAERCSIYR